MTTITANHATSRAQYRTSLSGSTRRGSSLLVRSGFALLVLCLGGNAQAGDAATTMESIETRAGYSAGYEFGSQLARLQRQKPGIELEAVFRGILDAMSGSQSRLSSDDMRAALKELEQSESGAAKTEAEKIRQLRQAHTRNRGYIDDFAALNAKREGVVCLPSGVQYEVLKAGNGKQPAATDAVLVSYQGSLTNGAVFDTTYEEGKPARLELAEIAVPGLKEALLLMNEGAKWRVVIPPNMGFKRSGNNMLRRRDLIYEIELVSVEAAEDQAAVSGTSTSTSQTDAAKAPLAEPTADTP